jgi:hypothetical protein
VVMPNNNGSINASGSGFYLDENTSVFGDSLLSSLIDSQNLRIPESG